MTKYTSRALSLLAGGIVALSALAGCGASPESVGASGSAIVTPLDSPITPVTCTFASQQCDSELAATTNLTCVPASGNFDSYTVTLSRSINGGASVQVATLGEGETVLNGISLTDTYPLAATAQVLTYQVCTQATGAPQCAPSFTVTSLDELNCETIAPTTPSCPTGEVYNPTSKECVVTCKTPACICRAEGGTWDGKHCE